MVKSCWHSVAARGDSPPAAEGQESCLSSPEQRSLLKPCTCALPAALPPWPLHSRITCGHAIPTVKDLFNHHCKEKLETREALTVRWRQEGVDTFACSSYLSSLFMAEITKKHECFLLGVPASKGAQSILLLMSAAANLIKGTGISMHRLCGEKAMRELLWFLLWVTNSSQTALGGCLGSSTSLQETWAIPQSTDPPTCAACLCYGLRWINWRCHSFSPLPEPYSTHNCVIL